MLRYLTLLSGFVLAACHPLASTPGPGTASPDPAATAPAGQPLMELNARARGGAVTETISGLQVADPYRTLEQKSPTTDAWIAAQTKATRTALAPFRDAASEARLRELLSIGMIGDIARGGPELFFTMRDGDQEQAALYWHRAGRLDPKPLVDPLTVGPRAALDYVFPSPNGRYIAFGISHSGDERSRLQVMDVKTRKTVAETIDHAKWTSLSWLQDETGFYYTRYPRPDEPRYDQDHADSYFPGIFFHRLGTDPARDPLIFQSDTGTDFPAPSMGDHDRHLLVMNYRGWTASDVYLLDRGIQKETRVVAPDASHPLVPITTGQDKLTSGVIHGGDVYLMTNEDAPRNRIVRVAPDSARDRSQWRNVVPESDATIDDWSILKGHLAVHTIRNVRSELKLYTLGGSLVGNIALPADGSVNGLTSDPDHDTLHFGFSSFFVPPIVFGFRVGDDRPTQVHQVEHDLDTDAHTLQRAQAQSKDGTAINIFFVHRRDLAKDGQAPVLLRGYGGFDISLLPAFTRTALHWIEQGGIYAVANLRGGGEFGEAWHRAGMLTEKHHVFEDFEASIAYFSKSGLSRPGRIAIAGGSNGGLLMGAMITRSPSLFAAAVADVGLYDMLRYVHFPPAQLWISEYGDPKEPKIASYLHSYSPYHRVKLGTPYPAVLIQTADHDTRVHWAHSTKFAARLQEATSSDRPIHFHMEKQMGHGRGTRLSDMVEKVARQHAFLRGALGL